jgi:hypothetical protein
MIPGAAMLVLWVGILACQDATNIAEDVIYMIVGEVVRHRVEEYRATQPATRDDVDL